MDTPGGWGILRLDNATKGAAHGSSDIRCTRHDLCGVPSTCRPRRGQPRGRLERRRESARRLHGRRLRRKRRRRRCDLRRRRSRGLRSLPRRDGRQRGHRRLHGRSAPGVSHQKTRGPGTRHAWAPHRIHRLPHPAVLPRHGSYARLAASRVFRSAREHHERGTHRAAPARSHRLCERLVLHQRVQIARPRSAHHGRPHRHRLGGQHRLVDRRHLSHRGSPHRGRPACRAHGRHGQPLPRERGHHPGARHRGQVHGNAQQVQNGQRHRASHRPRPQDRNGRRRGRYANHCERR